MSFRRIIVAETRSPLDAAGYRPAFRPRVGVAPPGPGRALRLPVGVLRWNAPAPTLTVVVKVTLSFGRECEAEGEALWAQLAPEQAPLRRVERRQHAAVALHRIDCGCPDTA